jgi:hypothetical protein
VEVGLARQTKGQDTDQHKTKREFLDEWVKAMNEHGGFGKWRRAVARKAGDVIVILAGSVTNCDQIADRSRRASLFRKSP